MELAKIISLEILNEQDNNELIKIIAFELAKYFMKTWDWNQNISKIDILECENISKIIINVLNPKKQEKAQHVDDLPRILYEKLLEQWISKLGDYYDLEINYIFDDLISIGNKVLEIRKNNKSLLIKNVLELQKSKVENILNKKS